MTTSASAASSRGATVEAAPNPAIPRKSGWSFETTSARRQAAMIGTCSSSANRISSVEVRARRTPAPARMTGRSAEASSSMTARTSSSVGRGVPGRAVSGRTSSGIGSSRRSSEMRQDDRPGPTAERLAARLGHRVGDVARGARLGGPLGETAERGDLVDLLERLAARAAGARPGRSRRTSGSNPGGRCGSRCRGSCHRRRASRGRPPGGRSAVRVPRP